MLSAQKAAHRTLVECIRSLNDELNAKRLLTAPLRRQLLILSLLIPVPPGNTRDEREYLFSAHSSTGGVQRFKAGHHGAAHSVGAMIGYIQEEDIDFWDAQMQRWLRGLIDEPVDGWTIADAIRVTSRDMSARSALLGSTHRRSGGLTDIQLHHLWIEMSTRLKVSARQSVLERDKSFSKTRQE